MPLEPRADRFSNIDTLRGFAVLGILAVNIQYFAMVWTAGDYPYSHMDFTSFGNRAVWWIGETFFTLKFITIFSALFGAGIVLMLGDGDMRERRHWQRMSWLLLFGLIHAYVFWFGDILVPYALAGMVIVAARRMSVGGLLGLGGALIAFTGLLMISMAAIGALVDDTMSPAEAMGMTTDRIADIEALYQSGFFARMPYNMGQAIQFELIQLVAFGGRIAGMMLVGMALFKSGFLTLQWTQRCYALNAGLAIAAGLILCGGGATLALATNFDADYSWQHQLARYIGSLVLAYGYASAIMLICLAGWVQPVTSALAATGRMAFSNYIGQTLIMTFIFVGFPGLGLFGEVERTGQALIVLAVWAFQITASVLWLQRFHYGPLEWAWRSLTYAKAQPWKRQAG